MDALLIAAQGGSMQMPLTVDGETAVQPQDGRYPAAGGAER